MSGRRPEAGTPEPTGGRTRPTTQVDDAEGTDGSDGPPLKHLAAVAVLVIGSLVALAASPWHGATMYAYFGVVPGLLALHVSWRTAAISAVVTAVAVFVGVWVSGSVPLSVIWMTLLALGIGASSRVGWAGIGSMIGAQTAIVIVSGKVFTDAPAPFDTPHTAAGALPVAAFALGGGLLMTLGAALFLRGHERPAGPKLSIEDTRWYTATMVLLVCVGTWVCRAGFPGTHAWWFLLTVFVVLLPVPEDAVHRMHDRAIGTAVGALAVMAVTIAFGVDPTLHRVIAVVGVLGVLVTSSRSVTVNAGFITVTVLAMATPGANNALVLHGERIGLTLLGVGLTWATLVGLRHLRRRLSIAQGRGPGPTGALQS